MNILISGGSRGIGRACVEKFCRDGHSVALLYNNSAEAADDICKTFGCRALRCDICDSTAVSAAVSQALKLLGGIDVLVNCAGISELCFFDTISDSSWRKMIDTNLSGAFYLCRAVAHTMIAQKSGKIINIGSMWGKVGASCEVHYSASKAGLRGLTMALSKELGPSGITVNCVEPGVIDTDMNAHLSFEDIAALAEQTPLGRIGKTHEVAALVSFLASEDAAFITGQCIGIDGGFAV